MSSDRDFFHICLKTDFIKITAESQPMQKESESDTFTQKNASL